MPERVDAEQVEAGQGEIRSRRSQRRLQHQDLSRRQLLDSAEEVFGRKGYHETTLKEVAELAEFSVGSVYSFFASKDDLFRHIFARRGDELLREMVDAAGGDGDPATQLHQLVDVQIGFFRRHPNFGRLTLRYANVTRLAADRLGGTLDPGWVTSVYDRAMALQAELFARGQRTGAFRDGDADALSRIYSGMVLSFQTLDVAPPENVDRYPLDAFHQLVARAFIA